jgi:hypothetical protein
MFLTVSSEVCLISKMVGKFILKVECSSSEVISKREPEKLGDSKTDNLMKTTKTSWTTKGLMILF